MSLVMHELNNKKFQNWLKACLSLKYSAEGLVDFLDSIIRKQHADCLNMIKKKHGDSVSVNACTSCKIKTVKPAHDCGKHKMCPLNYPKCNCMKPNGKLACPNKICSEMYDCMIILHKNGNPNWQNTSISEWYSNYWEMAKSCIPGKGYVKKKSAIETDIAGLLWVVINNKEIQNHLHCIINAKTDIFTKTRDKRNKLVHSTTLEYEDRQLENLISNFILILEDPRELKSDTGSQNAIKKLKQLKQEDCVVPEDEASCIIAEMKQNGIRRETSLMAEIKQMKEPALQGMHKLHQSPLTVTKERQEKLKHVKHDTLHMQKDDHTSKKRDTYIETEEFHAKEQLSNDVRLLTQAHYQEECGNYTFGAGFREEVEHKKDKRKRHPSEKNKQYEDMRALSECYQEHNDAESLSLLEIMKQEEEAEQKDRKKRRLAMKYETKYHIEYQEVSLAVRLLRVKLHETFPDMDSELLNDILDNQGNNLKAAVAWVYSNCNGTTDMKQSMLHKPCDISQPTGHEDCLQKFPKTDTNTEDNSGNANSFVNTMKTPKYWQHARDECHKKANKEFDRGRYDIGSYFASMAREATQKMIQAKPEEMLLPVRGMIDLRRFHNEDAKYQLETIFTGQTKRYCDVDWLIIVTGKENNTAVGNRKQRSSKCMRSNVQLYLKKNKKRFGYEYTEPNQAQNVGHFEVFFQ